MENPEMAAQLVLTLQTVYELIRLGWFENQVMGEGRHSPAPSSHSSAGNDGNDEDPPGGDQDGGNGEPDENPGHPPNAPERNNHQNLDAQNGQNVQEPIDQGLEHQVQDIPGDNNPLAAAGIIAVEQNEPLNIEEGVEVDEVNQAGHGEDVEIVIVHRVPDPRSKYQINVPDKRKRRVEGPDELIRKRPSEPSSIPEAKRHNTGGLEEPNCHPRKKSSRRRPGVTRDFRLLLAVTNNARVEIENYFYYPSSSTDEEDYVSKLVAPEFF